MKNTIIKLVFIFLLILSNNLTQAQTSIIGIHLGGNDYNGDYGNYSYEFRNPQLSGAISFRNKLNSSFDVGALYSMGKIKFARPEFPQFEARYINLNAIQRYKFDNGYILPEDFLLSPFITGGVGFVIFQSNQYLGPRMGLNVPLGGGVALKLNDKMGIEVSSIANYPLNDTYDGRKSGNYSDIYLFTSIGLTMDISSKKNLDSDDDGVLDKVDLCPYTTPGMKVNQQGCPVDNDNDGVLNEVDKCPDLAGLLTLNGCPDTDGDGVADYEDPCANIAGPKKFNGCPDTDGDGVEDAKDKCADVAGLIEFNGCPDKDGDGVQDVADKCPDIPGEKIFNGCPDSDGDGVEDTKDKCPTLKGSATNNGCPAEDKKAEAQKKLEAIFRNINFQTGKSILKPSSFASLDIVYKILKDNPDYILTVEGHTDNTGSDETNLRLSQNRADAVKIYLVKKGIPYDKIKSVGYGSTVPVESNKTAEGRTLNRRVELRIQ